MKGQKNSETLKSIYIYIQATRPNTIYVSKELMDCGNKLFLLYTEKRDIEKKTIYNLAKVMGAKDIYLFGKRDDEYSFSLGNKRILNAYEQRALTADIFLSKTSKNPAIMARMLKGDCIVLAQLSDEGVLTIFELNGKMFAFTSTYSLSDFMSKNPKLDTSGYSPLAIEVKRLTHYLTSPTDVIVFDEGYKFNEYDMEFYINVEIVNYINQFKHKLKLGRKTNET